MQMEAAGFVYLEGKFDTFGFDGDIVNNWPLGKNGKPQSSDRRGLGVKLVEEKWRRYPTPGKEVVRPGRTE